MRLKPKPRGVLAVVLVLLVLVVANPEVWALVMTIQAIGPETALLLLALQTRSVRSALALRAEPAWRQLLAAARQWRYGMTMLVFGLAPRPEHPLVLRHLGLWLSLRLRLRQPCAHGVSNR